MNTFDLIWYIVSILQYHDEWLISSLAIKIKLKNPLVLEPWFCISTYTRKVKIYRIPCVTFLTTSDFTITFTSKGIRMNPYSCIATGREEGMIEIVTNTMTISKIQLWYNHCDFVEESLYEWLKFHNPNEERSVWKPTPQWIIIIYM